MKSIIKSIAIFALIFAFGSSHAQTDTPSEVYINRFPTEIKDKPIEKCPINLHVYNYGLNLEIVFNTSQNTGIEFKIIDITGRTVISEKVYPDGLKTLKSYSIDNVPAGIYFVNAVQGKDVFSKKVYIGG